MLPRNQALRIRSQKNHKVLQNLREFFTISFQTSAVSEEDCKDFFPQLYENTDELDQKIEMGISNLKAHLSKKQNSSEVTYLLLFLLKRIEEMKSKEIYYNELLNEDLQDLLAHVLGRDLSEKAQIIVLDILLLFKPEAAQECEWWLLFQDKYDGLQKVLTLNSSEIRTGTRFFALLNSLLKIAQFQDILLTPQVIEQTCQIQQNIPALSSSLLFEASILKFQKNLLSLNISDKLGALLIGSIINFQLQKEALSPLVFECINLYIGKIQVFSPSQILDHLDQILESAGNLLRKFKNALQRLNVINFVNKIVEHYPQKAVNRVSSLFKPIVEALSHSGEKQQMIAFNALSLLLHYIDTSHEKQATTEMVLNSLFISETKVFFPSLCIKSTWQTVSIHAIRLVGIIADHLQSHQSLQKLSESGVFKTLASILSSCSVNEPTLEAIYAINSIKHMLENRAAQHLCVDGKISPIFSKQELHKLREKALEALYSKNTMMKLDAKKITKLLVSLEEESEEEREEQVEEVNRKQVKIDL